MGQRLNIEVAAGKDTPLVYANCYYHWSAYTLNALYTVKAVIDNYYKIKDEYKDDMFLLAAKMFEIPDTTIIRHEDGTWEWGEQMAGLCESSMHVMRFLYPGYTFQPGVDRNVGLIGISPADVNTTRDWEEGRAYIDISSEVFSFNIWWDNNEKDFKEWFELRDSQLDEVPILLDSMVSKFENFFEFKDIDQLIELIKASHHYKYERDEDEWVYLSWTE